MFARLLFAFCCFSTFAIAQKQSEIQIYPPNWWIGMKHNNPQLFIKTTDGKFNSSEITTSSKHVTINKIHRFENEKYVAVDIAINTGAIPGEVIFNFKSGKKIQHATWYLKAKDNTTDYAQGATAEDFIYLIMPDRFSNGDVTNDRIPGMKDQTLNRDSIFYRHGGDIQGIINRLDYLHDLGVTALWLMPVFENDMPHRSEHGYAITNHYKIDQRLGSAETYKTLASALHKRGMKLIQDAVYNHVGLQHFFIEEKPSSDWLNEWPEYTNTTYKDQPLMDPYAAEDDIKRMSNGWFTPFMPDLNQRNPYVANFLIQHAIWSVEEFKIDGFRIDTYAYNDLEFMNRCNQALLDEYPTLSIFGETWVHGVPNQAYFTKNNMATSFTSNLPGVTDFQTNLYGIQNAVNEPFGWTNGVNKLYQTLANDFVYKDPTRNVIFLDNHDLSRFFSVVGEDVAKHKIGLAWLLTCRGIPQLYYGTEINMKGITNPDGWVRLDFPGGWKGDKVNKFTAAGRTKEENETFNWIRSLATFRKYSSALKTGKLMQYVPENGVYVYFRYDQNQTIMCVMNTNSTAANLDLTRFAERVNPFTSGVEIATQKKFDLSSPLKVASKYLLVLELKE